MWNGRAHCVVKSLLQLRNAECVNNGTAPSIPVSTYANERTFPSVWATLVNVEWTEAVMSDRRSGRLPPLPAGRPMNDRRHSDHGLGPIWIDMSVIVALLIAIAAVASWVAAFAALVRF